MHHDDQNEKDDNLRGIYLHIMADALGSIACIISAFLIYKWQLYFMDPVISIIISLLIIRATYDLIIHSSTVLINLNVKIENTSTIVPLSHKIEIVKKDIYIKSFD